MYIYIYIETISIYFSIYLSTCLPTYLYIHTYTFLCLNSCIYSYFHICILYPLDRPSNPECNKLQDRGTQENLVGVRSFHFHKLRHIHTLLFVDILAYIQTPILTYIHRFMLMFLHTYKNVCIPSDLHTCFHIYIPMCLYKNRRNYDPDCSRRHETLKSHARKHRRGRGLAALCRTAEAQRWLLTSVPFARESRLYVFYGRLYIHIDRQVDRQIDRWIDRYIGR